MNKEEKTKSGMPLGIIVGVLVAAVVGMGVLYSCSGKPANNGTPSERVYMSNIHSTVREGCLKDPTSERPISPSPTHAAGITAACGQMDPTQPYSARSDASCPSVPCIERSAVGFRR